jgi:hypothetical protein
VKFREKAAASHFLSISTPIFFKKRFWLKTDTLLTVLTFLTIGVYKWQKTARNVSCGPGMTRIPDRF